MTGEAIAFGAVPVLLLLLSITLVHTFIVAIFILQGYPAAAPSVLPLTVEEQYPVQIWYQGPLFFATTALTAGGPVLAGRLLRRSPVSWPKTPIRQGSSPSA